MTISFDLGGTASNQGFDARIFNLAREVVGLFTHDGVLRSRNPHWSPLEDLYRIHDLTDPQHHCVVDEALARVRANGEAEIVAPFRGGTMSCQWRFQANDDDTLWVALTPLDPGPSIGHTAAAHAAVGIAFTDAEGRLHYVNDAFTTIYGYSRDELIGRMFTDLLPEARRERALARHRAHIDNREDPGRLEVAIVTGNGEHRIVDLQTGRVVLPAGVFRMSTVFDVTEVRAKERHLADTEARYRHIFESTSEGIYRSTPDGRLTEVNWPFVRMHRCRTKEELIESGQHLATDWYVDAGVRNRFIEKLKRSEYVENFEAEAWRRGTGERFWASESASAIRDDSGTLLYFQGTVRDITGHRHRRELATKRAEILEQIARDGDLVDILYEIVGAIEHYQPRLTVAICRLQDGLLQVQAAPGLANSCIDAIDGHPPSEIGGPIAAVMSVGEAVVDAQMTTTEKDQGSLAPILLAAGYSNVMALPVRNQSDAVLGTLAIFVAREADTGGDLADALHEMAQITSLAFEQQSLTEQLRQRAQFDPLTGLPNRTLFDDRLNHLMLDAGREDYPVSVMMLDLDDFKLVNDTLGHRTGDALLQEIAQRLQQCLRAGDTVARFGGDEFVVVAPLIQALRASDVAERILEALRPTSHINGHELHARPSIGISLFPQDGLTAESLIQAADTAMYAAKRSGKNHYRFFSEAMNQEVTERLRIEAGLRRALEHDELILHYQPVLTCADERVVGAEALLRWQHPERGLLSPGQFLPIAELTDLIGEVDTYVLKAAARQIAHWRNQGQELPVSLIVTSLNLSAHGLHEEGFSMEVARILEEAAVPPSSIELEITESMIMRDFEGTIGQLRDLRERAPGIRIALDDFGTGYSSFEYLRQLPVDTLKIDRSFIVDLDRAGIDRTTRAIVKTIVELGHNLDLTVVGEGIETRQQAEFLRSVGCDRIQGFLFAKPAPVPEFEAFVTG